MTDSCNACGSTKASNSALSLMDCKRCKSVAYCSVECQRQDWKAQHKTQCKRQELARAPCDGCFCMVKEIKSCCLACGFLQCTACDDKQQRLLDAQGNPVPDFMKPCPHCKVVTPLPVPMRVVRKFERQVVDANPNDPRQVHWLDALGNLYMTCEHTGTPTIGDKKKNAKKAFLRAGKLGFGQGYYAAAEMYLKERNWDQAKRYYHKAAKLCNVKAIYVLGVDAIQGGFLNSNNSTQQEPDFEAAFRWFQEGAKLADPQCCANLAQLHNNGEGTEKDLVQGFNWSRRAAKGGNAQGMRQCGYSYLHGKGVEFSLYRATKWFEKSLKTEDNEQVRATLYQLQHDADFVIALSIASMITTD